MIRALCPALALLLPGCGGDKGGDSAAAEAELEWGYDGEIGPENWGELSEEWATCAEGAAQSPIDVDGSQVQQGSDPLSFAWGTTSLRAYNSGHYVRYEVDPGSSVTTSAGAFDLLQFHFHARSEHTVDGESFDLEAHFVHQSQADPASLLVVAFFLHNQGHVETDLLSAGGALKFHDAVALPVSEEPTDLGGTVDLSALAATVTGHVSYDGSLTTPPCTEGVRFYLSEQVLVPDLADIAAFEAVYDHNYRPVQPLNGRALVYTSAE